MRRAGGFTLIETMIGLAIMSVVIVALMGSLAGQSYLNANARNLTAAMNDATRIMEQIRQQNIGCTTPSARPPSTESWNEWLSAQSPGKSINQPRRNEYELIAVTCQDGAAIACQAGSSVTCPDGTSTVVCPARGAVVTCPDGTRVGPIPPYCGPNQTGRNEWLPWYRGVRSGGWQQANTEYNPLQVTVAIGWRQQQRLASAASGGTEFTYVTRGGGCESNAVTDSVTIGPDADTDGVIESQAMLTTVVTCR